MSTSKTIAELSQAIWHECYIDGLIKPEDAKKEVQRLIDNHEEYVVYRSMFDIQKKFNSFCQAKIDNYKKKRNV